MATIMENSTSPSRAYKIGLACFSCLQNALIGGVIFGWAGIDDTLLVADLSEGGAGLASSQTATLFSYGASAAMVAPLLMGPVLDTFGPRIAILASHTLVLLGFAGFSCSQAYWHFAVSVVTMSFGGPGLQLAIIHVANLFPENKFLAVSFLTGSITLSFSMLAVLESIWEMWGVGFRALFGGYCVIIAASMVGTMILSPDDPFELPTEEQSANEQKITREEAVPLTTGADDNYQNGHTPTVEDEYIDAKLQTFAHRHKHHMLMTDESFNYHDNEALQQNEADNGESHPNPGKTAADSKKVVPMKDQSFYCQVKSATFIRAVIIFVSMSFMVNFTIASLNTEMADITTFSHSQRRNLTHAFSFLLTLGMPCSVLVGFLMDQLGLEAVAFLGLLVGEISTVFLLAGTFVLPVGNFFAMVCGFAVYSFFRQFVFVGFLSWISSRLGVKYFGILSGIGFAIAGSVQYFFGDVVNILHNDYNMEEENESNPRWMTFHIVQICVLGVLMVIPYQNYQDQKREEEEAQRARTAEDMIHLLVSEDAASEPASSGYGAVQ